MLGGSLLSGPLAGSADLDQLSPLGDNSLLTLYEFDGNTADATGGVNASGGGNYVSGLFDQAVLLGPSANKVVGHRGISYGHTVSMWFKPDVSNWSSDRTFRIFTQHQNQYYYWSFLNIDYSASDDAFRVIMNVRIPTTYRYCNTGHTVQFNKTDWNLITFSFASATNYQYSINGQPMAVCPFAGGNGTPSALVSNVNWIGGIWSNGVAYYSDNFSVDRYRHFNRQLTSEEISTLYNEK
jgi:hypothetical protein